MYLQTNNYIMLLAVQTYWNILAFLKSTIIYRCRKSQSDYLVEFFFIVKVATQRQLFRLHFQSFVSEHYELKVFFDDTMRRLATKCPGKKNLINIRQKWVLHITAGILCHERHSYTINVSEVSV